MNVNKIEQLNILWAKNLHLSKIYDIVFSFTLIHFYLEYARIYKT